MSLVLALTLVQSYVCGSSMNRYVVLTFVMTEDDFAETFSKISAIHITLLDAKKIAGIIGSKTYYI